MSTEIAKNEPVAVILELVNNRAVGVHPCYSEEQTQLLFEEIVREYGVEPTEECLNEGIILLEDVTIEIVKCKEK